MSDSVIIKNLVKSFVKTEVSFTSVDIANEIKKMGVWIRNREISKELKNLFHSDMINYEMSDIKVKRSEDDVEVIAILYHHVNKNPTEYLNVEAKAVSPDNFFKSKPVKQKLIYLDINDKIELNKKRKAEIKDVEKKEVKPKVEDNKGDSKDSKINDSSATTKKGFSKSSKRDYTSFNFI